MSFDRHGQACKEDSRESVMPGLHVGVCGRTWMHIFPDSSHSQKPAGSVVDSMEEPSDECWDSNSEVSVSDTD